MARGKTGRAIAISPPSGLPREGEFVHGTPVIGPTVAVEAYFAGPLPAPDVLLDYDHALEGTADRIIRLAEQEAAHRHLIERRLVEAQARNSMLGIASGLALGMSGVLGGVYAVVHGADIAGAGVALTALAALAGVFVTQRRAQARAPAAHPQG